MQLCNDSKTLFLDREKKLLREKEYCWKNLYIVVLISVFQMFIFTRVPLDF